MKKIILFFLLTLSAFTLCSCEVNWFRTTVDVPWYYVVIPVAVLFVVLYTAIIKSSYCCPGCGAEFKPKWYQFSITIHCNGKRLVKCPECGKTCFCKQKRR